MINWAVFSVKGIGLIIGIVMLFFGETYLIGFVLTCAMLGFIISDIYFYKKWKENERNI